MINKNKKYWFYLEPYSFIFEGDGKYVIYNTLNSSYICCPEIASMQRCIQALLMKDSGYCTLLQNELDEDAFYDFILAIRASFSGDIVEYDSMKKKPFIFKPKLRLSGEYFQIEEASANLRRNIVNNLHEVTLYGGKKCDLKCNYCHTYHKQFLYCLNRQEKIEKSKIFKILHLLNDYNISIVNFLSFDWDMYENMFDYWDNLKFKKNLYIHQEDIIKNYLKVIWKNWDCVYVLINNYNDHLINLMEICKVHENKKYVFVIQSEEEFRFVANLVDTHQFSGDMYEYKPFYNGKNEDFFKEFIYNSLDDIIEIPIPVKTILRRHVINEAFFGKITLFIGNGTVYSNVNSEPIGNIYTQSLNEIIYYEMNNQKTWLKIRNKDICKNCVNRYLCPSISNYELVIGKYNLCHIS